MERVILVTGASRGIGKTIAERLAKRGDVVIVNYIKEANLAEKTCQIIRNMGAIAEKMQCDVSDKLAVANMVNTIITKFGRIDVLINNAGILINNFLLQTKEEDFDKILSTNFLGGVNCCESVLPNMQKNHYGRIVNISSVSVVSPLIGSLVYAVSKAMINQYTLHTAYKYIGQNITVNAVISGFIDTDMAQTYRKYESVMTSPSYPCIYGTTHSIADGVAFFADEKLGFVTGQLLTIDGGYSLQVE